MSAVYEDALAALKRHSITYVAPIAAMPPKLHETMLAAYLLMRGIDEIEDDPALGAAEKVHLLRGISDALQERDIATATARLFAGRGEELQEVSLRLADWASLPPPDIAPRVLDAFACMSERMARWVERGFRIGDQNDFERYIHAVAGALALMFGDIWAWYDGTPAHRPWLLGYARGIQAANILHDLDDDLERGVSFWPPGWDAGAMCAYAERELWLADRLMATFPESSPARRWCEIPMARAWQAVRSAQARIPHAETVQ